MISRLSLLFAVVLCFIGFRSTSAQSLAHARIEYRTHDILTGLNCPWEILWGPDSNIWFTERAGRVNRVNPETGKRRVLLTILDSVYQVSESGLCGLALHPEFPGMPYVFIYYTYRVNNPADPTDTVENKVVRYDYDAVQDTLLNPHIIFKGIRGFYQHNGGRLKINDYHLFVTIGETMVGPLAQDNRSPNGKILRLNLDGSIPEDNPIPGSPIWTKGHRNPQGLVFASNGNVYETEHGTWVDDECNIILRGRNYGWPNVQGACDVDSEYTFCSDSNVVDPIMTWTPTVAPSGMDFYDFDRIPEWKNSILIATLKDTSLYQLQLDPTGTKVVYWARYPLITSSPGSEFPTAGRLRDLCISPDGRVFVSTSNVWSPEWIPDRILEIERVGVSGVQAPPFLPDDILVQSDPTLGQAIVSGLPSPVMHFQLVDQLGRVVRLVTSSGPRLEIHRGDLPSGVYYLTPDDKSIQPKRIVLQ